MMKLRIISASASLITILLFSDAFAADPGGTGFSFLKVSPGARNAGMGDIGFALPSKLYGVYFNPAVTSRLDSTAIGFMHHEYIFDTRREFLGVATPMLKGTVTISFDYFKIGSIESRQGPTEEPTGTFDARDVLFSGGYSVAVNDKMSLGLTAKYAAEKISSETADALLFDIGGQFHPHSDWYVGVAGRNIGSKPKFKVEEIDVPVIIGGGVGYAGKFIAAGVDVSKPKGSDVRVNFGAERNIVDFLALRAGYKIGYDEENVTFGIGFAKSIWEVDYAFVPYQSGLGTSHRFALTVLLR